MKSSGYPARKRTTPTAIWIVIPTYWGHGYEGVYDHPTPLDGKSTLPRLLDSLLQQEFHQEFAVLVLVSATSSKYEQEATKRVRQIISPYSRKLDILLADFEVSRFLDRHLVSHGLDLGIRSMRGYAAVRNLQLLIPAFMNAEIIIAVDDDEVLSENYMQRATKWIGKIYKGQRISGIAGPYLNDRGNPYIAEADKVSNILTDKSVYMNKTMRQLMAHPNKLIKTPMAFGGNMIFHRELFTQVGFDPAITRGEDIDYLINARISGNTFYFDPKLAITHLPPRHYEAPLYTRLRHDVIRFIYEQEKIRLHNLATKDFLPYPGRLLDDDFIPAALDALHTAATQKMVSQFGSPGEIILHGQAHAKEYAPQYVVFAASWLKAIKILVSHEIKDELGQLIKLTSRQQ